MQESKRISISNELAKVFSLVMAIWAVIVLAVEGQWTIPFWDLLLSLGFFLIPWINRRGYSLFGRFLFVILANGTLFLFPALFGENSGTHYCFLPATTLPFALFKTKHKGLIAFGVLLPMGLFGLLMATDFSLFPRYGILPEKGWIFWLTIFSAFLLSFFPIFYFSRANEVAESDLRASEQKYSQIVELAQEGIWVVDLKGKIQYANRALAKMLGCPVEKLHGAEVLDFIQEKDWEFTRKRWRNCRPGHSERFEQTFKRQDGKLVEAMVSSSPITSSSESSGRFMELFYDLTEARGREKIIEDQRAKMVAASKLSSLGEMAGGIAHEINNPLTAIHFRVSLLKKLLQNFAGADKIFSHLQEIQSVVMRIATIIEGLKKFSRDDTFLSLEEVPIKKPIEETLSFCQERFQVHGISLLIDEIPEGLTVWCRPVQISQILLNLLNNAFDAVSEGKGMVRIQTEEWNHGVKISVSDNGVGIEEEIAGKIFEPFFTTKPFGRGTGIGLSVSRGMAEAHGGEIFYEGLPGGGTRFVLILPYQGTPPGNPPT